MTTTTDPRPQLVQAFEVASTALAQTASADPTLPTPCADMNVDQLKAHLLAVAHRIAAMLDGRPAGSVADSIAVTTDWVTDFDAVRADVAKALTEAALDAPAIAPWRAMTIAEMAGIYASELVCHAWDLAVATGGRIEISDDLASVSTEALDAELPREDRTGFFARFAEQLPPGIEMGMPFGEVGPIGPDATPLDVVIAVSGRDPHWTPGR